MALGNNIKKFRRDLGYTQEELASILCITSQAVSKWESGAGLPDVTQIVPLAQALNVSTDALFGFNTENYDVRLAQEVEQKANSLRDSGEQSQGAYSAVQYLDQQCEENIFNYGIMTSFVQAVGHMSRYVNPKNSYYSGLMENDGKEWKQLVRRAENRAMQVIRYSGVKELEDKCHFSLAWLCWHSNDWEKGMQHVEALPSISSNMLKETLLPYFIYRDTEEGKENWKAQIRDNYQNFIRAINKQILYNAESMMWVSPLEEVEENCFWGLSIMDKFMENEKMIAHCQGYYRDTYKFLVAAYLRNDKPEKAAEEWKKLLAKIDKYVEFCSEVNKKDSKEVVRSYGDIAARNMGTYTRDWIDGKLQFMLGQLKGWSKEEVFSEFEKLV
ncbi:helix-turn-helix domain-containing protein [Butyrivibrio proteoclasticus]|uniref:helix-turn-helix domain-containing protein n=1 Tax=Butyrivibrio proteoclasticus TaxID=43305 RepID=UPI00047A40BC|nr:helix-turn-helix transcriptional regulator [Butyrivibrio proteoclasticus]